MILSIVSGTTTKSFKFALNLAKKRAKGTQTEDSDNEYYDDALKVVDEMRSHFLEWIDL